MADDPQEKAKEAAEKLLAIALQYDRAADSAPRVAAKGSGYIAEQILKLAEESDIPVHSDAELAEILSVLELDSYIPLEAYMAVAEILSYIYQKQAENRQSS